MRTIFCLFFLILFNSSGFTQSGAYPGTVKLITGTHWGDDTVTFKFYESPEDSTVARQLSFYFDGSEIPYKERLIEKDYHSWLSPMSFNDDTTSGYFRIYFTCKSQKGNWYEVIVNEKNQKTLWIENKRFVKFLSWKKLYKKKFFVSVKPQTKIYSCPDSSTTPINYSGDECFEILKIRGNWMEISNDDIERCGSHEPSLRRVWINFKSEDQLFIKVIVD